MSSCSVIIEGHSVPIRLATLHSTLQSSLVTMMPFARRVKLSTKGRNLFIVKLDTAFFTCFLMTLASTTDSFQGCDLRGLLPQLSAPRSTKAPDPPCFGTMVSASATSTITGVSVWSKFNIFSASTAFSNPLRTLTSNVTEANVHAAKGLPSAPSESKTCTVPFTPGRPSQISFRAVIGSIRAAKVGFVSGVHGSGSSTPKGLASMRDST
mmetsp:Transcript_8548/g.13326  ORF Transcript_8548/g.13326 Transcript_8548/m.13326 type:complete len:210 (-) Transcript_8548:349-978(-)